MDTDTIEHFDCHCGTGEHAIRFHLYAFRDGNPMLEMFAHLPTHNGFWRRLWLAVKYIAGVRADRGCDWSEWYLRPDDAGRLLKLLAKFIEMDALSKIKEDSP